MSYDEAARSLAREEVHELLSEAPLDIEGRLVDASNATLVARIESDLRGADGEPLRCVYKPVAGERPLWDFPDGTLGRREVAAYVVSEATGWDVVPPTVWRDDGPFGAGMCQLWVDTEDGSTDELVDVVPRGSVPPTWRSVLDALGADGRPVVLTHADDADLARMALFDVVVNNADRKGGHVLVAPDGSVHGVDHGVTFNVEPKLRTVLWGWAGEPIPDADRAVLEVLLERFDDELCVSLSALLADDEVAASRRRLERLLARGKFPRPSEGWPSIPWPAF